MVTVVEAVIVASPIIVPTKYTPLVRKALFRALHFWPSANQRRSHRNPVFAALFTVTLQCLYKLRRRVAVPAATTLWMSARLWWSWMTVNNVKTYIATADDARPSVIEENCTKVVDGIGASGGG